MFAIRAELIRTPEPAVGPLMRLRRMERECSALDGVSPALRAGASDFSLRGQRKVTKRKATPAKPPAYGGFPHLALWVGRNTADGTSLYQLRLRRHP